MPVSAGTPLIGVKSEGYLHELSELPKEGATDADVECHRLTQQAFKPERWPLRLALRLLKEANAPESPWEAYIQSTAIRPASALLWSMPQANELQYLLIKRHLRDELVALRSFYEANLATEPLGQSKADLLSFAALVSTAAARGIEVEDGRRALLPLIDLVCPPEGAVAAAERPGPPSCNLELEGDVAVVTAAHDLPSGEVLTRDHGLTHDELLVRHGLAAAGGSVKDDVVLWGRVPKRNAQPWQLRELRRVVTTEPGSSDGDLIIRSSVRRGKKLSDAIDKGIMHASRVLACERETDLRGVAEWATDERKASKGLAGLGSEQRRAVIANLVHVIDSNLRSFDTTVEQDEATLQSVRGNWKVAVAYRLEKKRVLQDVLALLERAKDREVEKRARSKEEAHLPAAVTGRKAKPESRSFKRGGFRSAGSSEGGAKEDDEPQITKGARVEILRGKFAGTVGLVDTELTGLGSVTVQLDNGSSVDYVALDNMKLLEPAPQEDSEEDVSEDPEKEGTVTERIAEAVAVEDLDAIFEVPDDTEKMEDDQAAGSQAEVEVEVVDAKATPIGDQAADPKATVQEASVAEEAPAEQAPEAQAQAAAEVEGTPEVLSAESVEVADMEPASAEEEAVPEVEGTPEVLSAESVEVADVEPATAEEVASKPELSPAEPLEGEGSDGVESAGGSSAEVSGLDHLEVLEDVDGVIRQMKESLRTLEMRKVVLAMQAAGVEEEKVHQVVRALEEQG